MNSFTGEGEEPVRTTTQIEDVARWLTLQRIVAVGMIAVLAAPMVLIAQQFIPPLAITGLLFTVTLALTWVRPRAGAIGIGVLSGLWLLLQLVNYSLVIPDLVRPSATVSFFITLGMLVFGIAGVVGLVGVILLSNMFRADYVEQIHRLYRRRDQRTDGLHVPASRPSQRILQTHGRRRKPNRRRHSCAVPFEGQSRWFKTSRL